MTGRKKPREFPEAFSREPVEMVRTGGLTIAAMAREMDLQETSWTGLNHRPRPAGIGIRDARWRDGSVGGPSPADLAAEHARRAAPECPPPDET